MTRHRQLVSAVTTVIVIALAGGPLAGRASASDPSWPTASELALPTGAVKVLGATATTHSPLKIVCRKR
jgi:hypothetical protein